MGLWSKIKKAVKKAVKKVVNTVKKIGRAIKEVVNRVLGVIGFIGSLLGIRPKKYLRLKIFILTENGSIVQKTANVQQWLDMASKVFQEKMNIEIRRTNLVAEEFIDVIKEDAPVYALYPNCSFSAAFSDAADYFEEQSKYSRSSTGSFLADFFGFGEPIFAFVVREISSGAVRGCAYPILQSFCLLAHNAYETTLVHEMCHICGLGDRSSNNKNLMSRNRNKDTDYDLTRWQISVVRNSRYVVFSPRRG